MGCQWYATKFWVISRWYSPPFYKDSVVSKLLTNKGSPSIRHALNTEHHEQSIPADEAFIPRPSADNLKDMTTLTLEMIAATHDSESFLQAQTARLFHCEMEGPTVLPHAAENPMELICTAECDSFSPFSSPTHHGQVIYFKARIASTFIFGGHAPQILPTYTRPCTYLRGIVVSWLPGGKNKCNWSFLVDGGRHEMEPL